jgi:UDP-glucose 4-epimerase
MKTLITGVAGFIASNLSEVLLSNKDIDLIGIDKELTSRIPFMGKPFDNIHYGDSRILTLNFKFIYDDINKIMSHIHDLEDIDRIYHLAASADMVANFNDCCCDLYNNTIGTHSILELMRKKDIPELVFASSSAVYGEAPIPMHEDMKDMRPISLYGASKLAAEAFIHSYVDTYGIKANIFRFGNVVGKNEHRGVIVDFIRKLKENSKELEILGDGKQIKSYFMVDDCIDALISLKPTRSASIYNLGAKDAISVKDVANIITNELGLNKVKYKYTGGDRGWPGDVPKIKLLIDKAIKAGWEPKFNCEESIRKTVRMLI